MRDILINVLFLLVILFIVQLFESQAKNLTKKNRSFFVFLLSAVSIIFCMTFSISLSSQFHFDIRAVPFILGSLMGGPVVSAGLYLFIVIFRLFLGIDAGFYGAALNYGLLTIPLLIASRRFLGSGTKQKILVSLSISAIHLLLSRFIYSYLFVSDLTLSVFLQVAFIKLAMILLVILTLERIRKNNLLRIKMENLERFELISHLSASISHEVRNGLTGAKGFIQLLKNKETDPLKSRYIQTAMEELERTENIIGDYLTFAKAVPQKIMDINIENLLNQTLKVIEPLANMNSVEIEKHLSPCWIKGDERKLQQAFLNIAKNAIEAMQYGGGRLEILMFHNQDQQIIIFKDSGTGMTQEQTERLGNPYFSTKGINGTGLGLMVTYRVIEEINGQIKVHSQLGKGTTFAIHLPRLPRQPKK